MANNRLLLLDSESGEYVTLAKGWGNGWKVRPNTHIRLEKFFEGKDVSASERGITQLLLLTEDQLASLEGKTGRVFRAMED